MKENHLILNVYGNCRAHKDPTKILMLVANNSASAAFADLCQVAKAQANEFAECKQMPLSKDTDGGPNSNSQIVNKFFPIKRRLVYFENEQFYSEWICNFGARIQEFSIQTLEHGPLKRNFCFVIRFIVYDKKCFKNGATPKILAAVFKMKSSKCQWVISKFAVLISIWSFGRFVNQREIKQTMSFFRKDNWIFTYYKSVRYPTDVMLHQSLNSCVSASKTRIYCSKQMDCID